VTFGEIIFADKDERQCLNHR